MGNKTSFNYSWDYERGISMGEAFYLSAASERVKKLASSQTEQKQHEKYAETYQKVGYTLRDLKESDPLAKEKLVGLQGYLWGMAKCDYKVMVGMHHPETDCATYALNEMARELLK